MSLTPNAARQMPIVYSSALTGFVLKEDLLRLYYLDANNSVTELAWSSDKKQWSVSNLITRADAPAAAPGSMLMGFVLKEDLLRLYYLDANNSVTELAWSSDNQWIAKCLS